MEVSLIKVACPFGGVGVEGSKLKLLCLWAKTLHVSGDIGKQSVIKSGQVCLL